MNETANTNEPATMSSGASSVEETEDGGRRIEADEWRERMVSAVAAAMERKVPPRELRVLWQVLEWSFGLGRETTMPFTVRDLAVRTGMTPAGSSRALNGLKEKHVIRKNADGGWQFTSESKFHPWMVPWRVDDEEERLAARRVDVAQGAASGGQSSVTSGQPGNGGTKNGDEKSKIGNWKARATQNKEQQTKDTMNMKDENADNHGMHETHGSGGGDGVFLPTDVANLAKPAPDAPLKSSPPSHKTLFNTINLLKREPVASLATTPEANPIDGNGTEAGMEKGSPIPEDPHSIDEETLIRRLKELLGQETMKKDGARLRLFIRGSVAAADCEDTAVAMRKAINETEAAVREGRIKKSVFGYLFTQAFYWAGQMGWRFDAATKTWVKGKQFNNWKRQKALLKSVAE